MAEGESYSAVETHGGNVTLDGSIFLVAAAHWLAVEVTLSQWLLKARALHLVHMHRPDPCR